MSTLPEVTATPCNECPWRREAWAGHLGPYTATDWAQLAHSDAPIACHKTINVDEEWDQPHIRQCAGVAIYRGNVIKSPRNPEVAVNPPDHDRVFSNPAQFIEHHDRSSE